jgi:hypothetical protein
MSGMHQRQVAKEQRLLRVGVALMFGRGADLVLTDKYKREALWAVVRAARNALEALGLSEPYVSPCKGRRPPDAAERNAISIRMSAYRRETERQAKIGQVVESLFDTQMLAGKPVGDWYIRELHSIRKTASFDATLAGLILQHARNIGPNTRVREAISKGVIGKIVADANLVAEAA